VVEQVTRRLVQFAKDFNSRTPIRALHVTLILFVENVPASANVSDAAMEWNMELGVLLRGGQLPGQLDRHLAALVTTIQLRAL
jgi:hypothetical protein